MQTRGSHKLKWIAQVIWRVLRSDALLWIFLLASWGLIFTAATRGLQRDTQQWLPIKLVAQVSADYSPKANTTLKLARVDPKIIDAIKRDAEVEKAISTPTLAVVVPSLTPTPEATPTPTATPSPLRVSIGGPYLGDEGSPIALTAGNFNSVLSVVPGSVTYRWDLDDDGVYDDGQGSETQVTFYDEGEYPIAVQAIDLIGRTALDQTTVTVSNVPPLVSFLREDTSAPEAYEIQFAAAAEDPGHDVLFFDWDFGDGTIGINDTLRPKHIYPDDGDFTVRLRVSDNDGGITEKTMAIEVRNVPPTVDAGSDITTNEGQAVTVRGSASDPSAQDTLTYAWDLDYDGDTFTPDTSDKTATVTYPDGPATKVAALRVRDDDGGETIDTIKVTVNNVSPVITDVSNNGPVGEGSPLTLSVAASDVSDDPLTFSFDWNNDGSFETTGQSPALHTWYDEGDYTVRIKVDDGDGGVVFSSTKVSTFNEPPVAIANADSVRFEGDPVRFDASDSTDPGINTSNPSDPANDILTYQWSFGDGSTGSGLAIDHTYNDNDVYTATLTVTDDSNAADTAAVAVTILNANPEANAGQDRTVDEAANVSLHFQGAATDPGNADTLTYEWDFDYDGNFTVDATGPDVIWPPRNLDGPRQYQVALRVRDDDYNPNPTDGSAIGEAIDTLLLTVRNLSPQNVNAGGPYAAEIGQVVTLRGSAADVPGDTPPNASLNYEWDLNYDGSTFTRDAAGQTITHTWAAAGQYPIRLRVTDKDGGETFANTVANINAVPIAVAAANPAVGLEGQTITFDGSGSSDPDLDPLTYSWNFGDGSPAATGITTTHRYPDNNVYTATLTVRDADGSVDTDTVAVTTLNANPVANTGPDLTATEGVRLDLLGLVFDPGTADAFTYSWDFNYDGVNFTPDPDVTGASTSVTYANGPDTVTVALRVRDDDYPYPTTGGGEIGEGFDTLVVTVNNAPPSAIMIVDAPYSGVQGQPVTLTGSAADVGPDTLTYEWDVNYDGVNFTTDVTGNPVTYTWPNGGLYTIALRVTDNDGGVSDVVSTQVNIDNIPTAVAGGPYSGNEGSPILFNGTGSSDPDGDGLTYTWNFGDGSPTTNGITVTHVYSRSGAFTATLQVDDGRGGTDTDQTLVTVNNLPPTAVANANPTSAAEGTPITFDGSGSSDPGAGDILTYQWNFGDGSPVVTGMNVTHAYPDNGVFTATLTVTDDDGASDTDTVSVTIQNAPPSAVANISPNPAPEGAPITFNGSGSSDPGPGDTLTYRWNFGDGSPTVSNVNATHTYNDNGVYAATLTVTDDDGAVDTATVNVTVQNVAPTANAGGPYSTTVGIPLTLTGTGSDIPADPLNFTWNLEDSGSTINIDGQIITYTWTTTGTFNVTLQVSDDDGGITTTSTTVQVNSIIPFAWLGTAYFLIRRRFAKIVGDSLAKEAG